MSYFVTDEFSVRVTKTTPRIGDSFIPALLDLFLFSDASICSRMASAPLGNSGHVFVSVSIDFPSNLQLDTPFHHVAYDYSCADWDGLHDHLRDVPWEDIFKLSASAFASEFCEWVQVGIDVYIVSSRSSLTHLQAFQQLVLLL